MMAFILGPAVMEGPRQGLRVYQSRRVHHPGEQLVLPGPEGLDLIDGVHVLAFSWAKTSVGACAHS